MDKKQAVELVKDSLKSLVSYPVKDINEDTKLVSKEGWTLDSMGMTALVIELEGLAQERYQKEIDMMANFNFHIAESPFRTVGTLADYVMELMK